MAVDIALRVRTQQLEQALESIPGLTRREVRKAVRGAEREWNKMPAAVRKAARESERAMTQRMQLLRQNVANVMGDVTNDIGDAVEMFGSIGPAGIAAGVGLAAVAVQLAAIGGAVYGVYSLIDGISEAREELRQYEEQGALVLAVTQEQDRATQQWQAALKGISVQLQASRVEIVSNWTPGLQTAATVALAATMAIRDFGNEVIDSLRAARTLAQEAEGLERVRLAIVTLGGSEATRALANSMDSVSGSVETAEQGAAGFAGYLAQAKQMMDAMGAGGDSISAPPVVPGRQARVPSSARRAAAAASSMGQFGPELTMDDDPSSIVETQTGVARLMEQVRQQELAAERAAAEERARIQQMERDQIRETMDMRRQAANELVGNLASTAQAFGANADAVAGAALIETIAMQAVAVARAFALDPITGALRAGVAVATIAPQIAQLARVSGRGAASAGGGGGGAAASGDMQRGPSRRRKRDPSGTITVVSEYRHQLLDRAVQDSTRRIGSPLRQELRARRRR